MKSTKMNGLTFLKRLLTLSLCLVMLIGSALAQHLNLEEFYTEENDYLFSLSTLKDGRLLIAGSKCLDESKDITRKWLLCLNPDYTVSWEYITPEEEAGTIFAVSERPDGTLAIVFDMGDEDHAAPEGARTKIRYFTQDGQPTGKEINLPGFIQSHSSYTDSYIVQTIVPDDENEPVLYIKTDWDGNEIETWTE